MSYDPSEQQFGLEILLGLGEEPQELGHLGVAGVHAAEATDYEALMTCDCQTHKLQAEHSKRLTPSLMATRSEHSPVRQGMGTSARAVRRAYNLCENT